jgi:hypothetical protein
MKNSLQTVTVLATIAASILCGCSVPKITSRADPTRPSDIQTAEGFDTLGRKWAGETIPSATLPPVLSRNESERHQFTGKITDIDYSTREISIQNQQGRIETFVVDKSVQRLNEAKVGDMVSVDYYIGLNAEVREPTDEERQNPLYVLDATGRVGPDAPTSAHGLRVIRAVVTIEGLDRPTQTLTVKGPQGRYFVTRVEDPSRLEKVRIGQTIVLTFTEAAVVSLKPSGKQTVAVE